jgi:phospholipid-binding lipoprotein MlaA
MRPTESAGARIALARAWRICLTALVLAFLGGCATVPGGNPRDPLEGFNRGVAKFNDGLDQALVRPLATAYRDVVPQVARTSVGNFFSNLRDAWSAVNSGLQLKGQAAAESVMRFSINTVFGVVGLFDVATEMKIERHREDFGQTLGRWGVPTGPYLVLPVLGPSTLRDALALPVDRAGNIVAGLDNIATRNTLMVLDAVDTRARLLGVGAMMEEAALDKYSFVRDVYLQRRSNDVSDGKEPDEPDTTK